MQTKNNEWPDVQEKIMEFINKRERILIFPSLRFLTALIL